MDSCRWRARETSVTSATRGMDEGETSVSSTSDSPIRHPQRIGRRRRRGERLIVVDGANVMFHYSKSLTNGPTPKGPLVARTRGLELCFEHWMKMGEDIDLVAFVPADLVEGPLWRVADGRTKSSVEPISSSRNNAVSVVRENVFFSGEAREADAEEEEEGEEEQDMGENRRNTHLYRNKILDALIADGKVVVVTDFFRWSRTAFPGWPEYDARGSVVRFNDVLPVRTPSRSKDDVAIIRHARENDGFCLSNDKFEDHRHNMGKYCGKGTQKWIQRRRIEFSFERQTDSSINGDISGTDDELYTFVPHATPFTNKRTTRLITRSRLIASAAEP